MATESSEEPQIDEEMLGAMLKFDEMLRSGKLNTGIESSDDHRLGPASEVLRMARDALCELEAAVPRRADSVPSWVPTLIGGLKYTQCSVSVDSRLCILPGTPFCLVLWLSKFPPPFTR